MISRCLEKEAVRTLSHFHRRRSRVETPDEIRDFHDDRLANRIDGRGVAAGRLRHSLVPSVVGDRAGIPMPVSMPRSDLPTLTSVLTPVRGDSGSSVLDSVLRAPARVFSPHDQSQLTAVLGGWVCVIVTTMPASAAHSPMLVSHDVSGSTRSPAANRAIELFAEAIHFADGFGPGSHSRHLKVHQKCSRSPLRRTAKWRSLVRRRRDHVVACRGELVVNDGPVR